MGQTTIEWTEYTWNPWTGCDPVSEGCKNCYMFRDKRRFGQEPRDVIRSKTTFDAPLKLAKPTLIFTCSWSDWFHEDADEWRDEAWDVIRRTPQHRYQILTKRPERIAQHLPYDWHDGWRNVWLGVSVENQRVAHRISTLSTIRAWVRFVSAEPLLGPIFFSRDHGLELLSIDWLIAGGESGPQARRMEEWWATNLRNQCRLARVPFFFKQVGGNRKIDGAWGGRLLEGQEHSEMPFDYHNWDFRTRR